MGNSSTIYLSIPFRILQLVQEYSKELAKTKRTYILLMIVLAVIGFVLGYFMAGGSIGVEGGAG